MFQKSIISDKLSIYKFFKQLNFDLYLTKPQIQNLENIMDSMISKDFKDKISRVAEFVPTRHRTSITRFLSNSSWNEKLLEKSLKLYVVELIWTKSRESKQTIYFIIDDTISFDLVTVKGKQYYIYNYVGNLKDRKNVSIVLSYPLDSFQKDNYLKAFISLDNSLEILMQYTDRCAIEPFFRYCKTYL